MIPKKIGMFDLSKPLKLAWHIWQSGMVIKFDNHHTSQHGGHMRNRRFSYPVRRFRCLFVIARRMYLQFHWKLTRRHMVATLGTREEQQAMMEVKFWAGKFQGGWIHTFEWGMFFNFAFKFRLVNEFCHGTKKYRALIVHFTAVNCLMRSK